MRHEHLIVASQLLDTFDARPCRLGFYGTLDSGSSWNLSYLGLLRGDCFRGSDCPVGLGRHEFFTLPSYALVREKLRELAWAHFAGGSASCLFFLKRKYLRIALRGCLPWEAACAERYLLCVGIQLPTRVSDLCVSLSIATYRRQRVCARVRIICRASALCFGWFQPTYLCQAISGSRKLPFPILFEVVGVE